MELLLRRGGGGLPQERNKEQVAPLHLAAESGHGAPELLELLIRHGGKVNALDGGGQTGWHSWGRQVGTLGADRLALLGQTGWHSWGRQVGTPGADSCVNTNH